MVLSRATNAFSVNPSLSEEKLFDRNSKNEPGSFFRGCSDLFNFAIRPKKKILPDKLVSLGTDIEN